MFLLASVALLLGGCSAADLESAFGPDDYTAEDDQECQSMGLSFGSSSYADCRMRLVELREARKRTAMQYYIQNQPMQPTTTNCYSYGYSVTCKTR
jgi:hypothetical protein